MRLNLRQQANQAKKNCFELAELTDRGVGVVSILARNQCNDLRLIPNKTSN
jgi:hypothetical protein